MNLIKEAIADAKAVKDIAKKNAMDSLTEAFTPQMQSIISRRLAEEGDDMEDEEEAPAEVPAEAPAAEAPAAETEMPAEEPPVPDEEDDTDIDEVLRELGEEDDMEEDPMMEVEDEMEEPMEDPATAPEVTDDELDEILGEVEDEMELEEAESCEDDELKELKAENVMLKRKLKEAHRAFAIQKQSLQEVGLLSAKLLYSNKILKRYDLSESQKLKVLEAFDRTKNLREAKLVFSTISEQFRKKGISKSRVTESVGGASKPIKAVVKPASTVISEEFVPKSRWKELAGIKD